MQLREFCHLTVREADLARFLTEVFCEPYGSAFRGCRVTSITSIMANGHPDRGGFKIEFTPIPPKKAEAKNG